MRTNSVLLLLLTLFLSCNEKPAPKVNTTPLPSETSPLPRGVVHPSVAVSEGSAETYAAYIPDSAEGTLPLVLFFDSHAKGRMVAEKYKALADELHFIIAVSNASKNGLDPKASIQIGKRMLDAIVLRSPANTKCVYAAGFSGGARVAVNFALAYPQVNGVIGCGAGYAPEQTGDADLDFFGIVGEEDFNFNEMMAVDSALTALHKKGFILTTVGDHAWPEPENMKYAIMWQRMESMRDGNIHKDSVEVQDFHRDLLHRIVLSKRGDLLHIVQECRLGISAFAGLGDIAPFEQQLTMWSSHPMVKTMISQRKVAMRYEMEKRAQIQPGVASWTREKWETEITKLKADAPEDGEKIMANKRVLNFLSLMFYMQGSGAINQRNLDGAEHFLYLYEMVDPTNSETACLNAQYYMLRSRPEQALDALAKAVDLGFDDKERLENDPILAGLKTQPRYVGILARLGE